MEKRMRELSFSQLPAGTVFKIGFVSNIALWGMFALIMGTSALFGAKGVTWNGDQVVGVAGLLTSFLLSAIFAFLGSCALMAGWAVARLAANFLGKGRLSYIVAEED